MVARAVRDEDGVPEDLVVPGTDKQKERHPERQREHHDNSDRPVLTQAVPKTSPADVFHRTASSYIILVRH